MDSPDFSPGTSQWDTNRTNRTRPSREKYEFLKISNFTEQNRTEHWKKFRQNTEQNRTELENPWYESAPFLRPAVLLHISGRDIPLMIFQFLVVDNSHMVGMKYCSLKILIHLLLRQYSEPGDEIAIAERSAASVISQSLIDSSMSKRNVLTYQFW